MKLPSIQIWRDGADRPATRQMALDEVLFRDALSSGEAIARVYGWTRPAVTVGYFHRFGGDDTETGAPAPVRRYTGGGLVEHGEDLTFLLALPPDSTVALAPGAERYRWIHSRVRESLAEAGHPLVLEEAAAPSATGACFARPVTWDLLDPDSRAKVGGGAQRRSRGGIIHQGSIRLPAALRDSAADWIDGFFRRIAARTLSLPSPRRCAAEERAKSLEADRYGRDEWNRPPGRPAAKFGL